MTLSTGTRLSHYEITSQIGKGGMGEVYQAKDTKLGRDVAIKVLPQEFAQDVERVARFQREAKLLASLNHPNIAAIYGLEESDGTNFLVMELVEGDTLADRIKSGTIPVEETLKLALQIAEALEAAHEKGVIHRDLKPANIKVTPDGKVKVLDFGLAKAFAGDQSDLNLSNSPTLSEAATMQGVILGTAAYMPPEQAKGKSVDKRADIWAFGVVLFEMLSGKPLFAGEDVSSTLARVLEREPNFSTLPQSLHPRIRILLERCLEKDPRDRYSGINDARVDIQKVLTDSSSVLVQPIPSRELQSRMQKIMPWAAFFILGALLTGLASWIFWPDSPQSPITRFAVELAGRLTSMDSVALSPDGSRFVYAANGQLYSHALDQMEPTAIPGTEEGSDPYFSPDGKEVAFSIPKQLNKVSLAGVAPVVIAEITGEEMGTPLVGAWDSRDRLFFGLGGKYSLYQVPASGGTPELFADVGDHTDLDYPDVLPGGEWVLFSDRVTSDVWSNGNIVALSTITGERKVILEGGHFARYAPTGHLVYAQNHTLVGIGFDADRVEVIGDPVPIIQNIATNENSGHAKFALAENGTLIYAPQETSDDRPQGRLVWVDRDGKETPLSIPPDDYGDFRISPDGTKVALTISNKDNEDIHIWDIARENMMKLTLDETEDRYPIWTPDGKQIVFYSGRQQPSSGIYWMAANRTGKVEFLSSISDGVIMPWTWSGDGNNLVLLEIVFTPVHTNIGMLSMEGDHSTIRLLQEKFDEADPQISPDGRWIAYQSDESGEWQIYVRPFPDVDKDRWIISTDGGKSPRWSPNDRELYYQNGNEVIAVAVETEPMFKHGKPELLFQGTYVSLGEGLLERIPWDVHPDGKRFLMLKPEEAIDGEPIESGPPKINVVLNWFEELKERVPIP